MTESEEKPNHRLESVKIDRPIHEEEFGILSIANIKNGVSISRRELLGLGGAVVASLGINGLLASCKSGKGDDVPSYINRISEAGYRYTFAAAHADYITALAWSPDGQKIASGEANTGVIKIWDTVSGNLIITISSGLSLVSMDWSPDGSQLAAISLFNGKVFDISTGQLQFQISGCGYCIKYSPDGARIATGDRLKLWDANSGTLLKTADDTEKSLYIDWSPDGSKVVCGYDYGAVKIWDSSAGTLLQNLEGHHHSVTVTVRVKWSPDGSKIASCAGGTLITWDSVSGSQTLSIETDSVGDSIYWSPDNQSICLCGSVHTSCGDCMGEIYDAGSGNKLKSIGCGMTDRRVLSALSPDGSKLLTGIGIALDRGILVMWSADAGDYIIQFIDSSLSEKSFQSSCSTPPPWMKSCSCNSVCVCDTVDYCSRVVCSVDLG